MAYGTCAEGFCDKAGFLHEVRFSEGHSICKISFVNLTLHAELKASVLPHL